MVKMMMKMVVEAVDHARGKAAVDQVELRHKLTPTTDCKYQRNYQTAYTRMMTMEEGRSLFWTVGPRLDSRALDNWAPGPNCPGPNSPRTRVVKADFLKAVREAVA